MASPARAINIYVPGILTLPGSAQNWSGRAVTHTHLHSDIRAEKVEYLSGPGFTRNLFQKRRAWKLTRTLEYYHGWNIRLIGHSNGCDVILDALREWPQPFIDQIHLVCAACEADFELNGLNYALRNERVESVHVYVADRDLPLRIARWIGGIFGFGTLGLDGAKSVHPLIRAHVGELYWPEWGHGDCWSDSVFAQTMDHFLR